MTEIADVCLLVEGGYPYMLGGVSSWIDALVKASPQLKFHIIAFTISAQERNQVFKLPDNVIGVTDIVIDECPAGVRPTNHLKADISRMSQQMRDILTNYDAKAFGEFLDDYERTGIGKDCLLESRAGWREIEAVYEGLVPNSPLVDFFWTWRFLVKSVLAIAASPIPEARIYHAVATGYAGLMGARIKHCTGKPFIVTEHGIYTNERRMEFSVAEWLYISQAAGYDVSQKSEQLHNIWLDSFSNFSRLAYDYCDVLTAQYRANQQLQRDDGAVAEKQVIIPNGIDTATFSAIPRTSEPHPPTVLMIGRIVPIKDIRTFILAVGFLKKLVPDVVIILIGPENEDPNYAKECRALVEQQDLQETIQFLGRVGDIKDYFGLADVIALTSISEAQPLALMEAAATGLPAVTTDVGSCRELIEGLEDDPVGHAGGIVVPPCDPEACAIALATILNDKALREKMGAAMKKRMQTVYSKERVTGLYEALYASYDAEIKQQALEVCS